tara:strand:+ start:1028 stop:1366 length:339 start_codon:yes stop_codon:yes gene_type:complete
MTNETVLFAIMIALPLITVAAYFIAQLIININDRNDQKALDAITAKYAARKIADEKHHAKLIADFSAETDRIHKQLLEMKNCPKWNKMKQEMAQEYAAMIKGRNQFNAMLNR